MRACVDTVKRLALSLSVIVLFALYALQKQAQPLLGVVALPESGAATARSTLVASPAVAWHPAAEHATTIPVATSPMTPTPSARTIAFFAGDAGATAATAAMTLLPPPTVPVATATTIAPTATAIPTAVPTTPALAQGQYRDGTYDGGPADANWGAVEVQAVIAGGRLQDMHILQYPDHHGRSIEINQQALPLLMQEAIQAQQADVDVLTGATDTSEAFIQSLGAALQQAAS
jgi:uncharacterized protein with FMN-binding domain